MLSTGWIAYRCRHYINQDFRFSQLKKRGCGVGVIQPVNSRQTRRVAPRTTIDQVGWHAAEAPTKRDSKPRYGCAENALYDTRTFLSQSIASIHDAVARFASARHSPSE